MSNEEAKKVFRKLANTTSHQRNFGIPPAASADYQILKTKRFAEVQFSQVLNQNVIEILDKWLATND